MFPWLSGSPRPQSCFRAATTRLYNDLTMIEVTQKLVIPEDEISWSAIRAAGPGGQHVNKVSSAVQLRFDIEQSAVLSAEQKVVLRNYRDQRITRDGVIVIRSQESRSQPRNREIALARLADLLRTALTPQRPRHKTRPTAASVKRRLEDKKQKARVKASRRPPSESS
jgi:ribosome-associated protein